MTAQQQHTSIELCVRSLAPTAAVATQIERIQRLEALVEAGAIGEYSVHVVGRGVVHENNCESCPAGKLLLDRLSEVETWAAENDARIPGFNTTTVQGSCVHEVTYTVTTVPQNFLLEYENDRLRCCSPSIIDGQSFSVDKHLSEISNSERTSEAVRTGSNSIETGEVPTLSGSRFL